MKTITIRLTSPLQSYGNEAKFNRRTSYYYPSKSAVIGMIAASLGYKRESNQIDNLKKLKFAIRIDQPAQTLTDFQVVEYHKSPTTLTKKVTYRNYLQDAVYIVAISSDDDMIIDQIKYALKHPKFQIYLGRKANVPAGILKINDFKNMNPYDVLVNLPWQASAWYQKKHNVEKYSAEIIADADLMNHSQTELVKDEVGSFNRNQRYHIYRAISTTRVSLKNDNYKEDPTNHDIMSFL